MASQGLVAPVVVVPEGGSRIALIAHMQEWNTGGKIPGTSYMIGGLRDDTSPLDTINR